MDRRQKKTEEAIFRSFGTLISKKSYAQITVQNIIDEADIGRSTFYAHFETKEDVLQELCRQLFGHIVASAKDNTHLHGLLPTSDRPLSIFHHILEHIKENDYSIITLLSSESSDIFLPYFRAEMNALVASLLTKNTTDLPKDFLVNHIAGSFVEMVLWWIKNGMTVSSENLDVYFETAAVRPFISE